MSKKSTLKIAKFIVFIACLIHLLNFLLGGAISVYNYVIPKYFSLSQACNLSQLPKPKQIAMRLLLTQRWHRSGPMVTFPGKMSCLAAPYLFPSLSSTDPAATQHLLIQN